MKQPNKQTQRVIELYENMATAGKIGKVIMERNDDEGVVHR